MAQQVINVGSVADDGTGDLLRTAFQKANTNFTELYSFTSDGSEVLVHALATGGDGTQEDPWTGWDASLTPESFTTYKFRKGWYLTKATPLNWLASGIEVIGEAGVFMVHGGTSGSCFIMDAGATSLWVQNVRVENIVVYGAVSDGTGTAVATASSDAVVGTGTAFLTAFSVGDAITFRAGGSTVETKIVSAVADNTHLTVSPAFVSDQSGAFKIGKTENGFYLRGVRNGLFRNLRAHDVHKAGIWTEACVTNILENFRCTALEPVVSHLSYVYWDTRPRYGIVTTASASRSADWSTTWTIINPVIEYLWDKGIWFKDNSYGNAVINGTSEGHVESAVDLYVDGSNNTIMNLDVEGNAANTNMMITGSRNTFISCFSDATITVNGSHNVFQAGSYQDLTLTQSGGDCYDNILVAPVVQGTFTDGGLATRYFMTTGTDKRASLGVVLRETAGPSISSNLLATDAATADQFNVNVDANFTLSNPTNVTNGHRLLWRLIADGSGPYTIAYGANVRAANNVILPRAIAASATVYLEGVCNSSGGDFVDIIAASTSFLSGSFTMDAAATKAVANTSIVAASKVLLTPTNAAAAGLMAGVKSLYVSAKTANTSFTVSTADASSAAGTETFDYVIRN
jgi:hypothetical protein